MINVKITILIFLSLSVLNFSIAQQNDSIYLAPITVKEFVKWRDTKMAIDKIIETEDSIVIKITNVSPGLKKLSVKIGINYDNRNLIVIGVKNNSLKIDHDKEHVITFKPTKGFKGKIEFTYKKINSTSGKWYDETITESLDFSENSPPLPNEENESTNDEKQEDEPDDEDKDKTKITTLNIPLKEVKPLVERHIYNLFEYFTDWWNRSIYNLNRFSIIEDIETAIGPDMKLGDIFIISGTSDKGDGSRNLNEFLERVDAIRRYRYVGKTIKYKLSKLSIKQHTGDKEYIACFCQKFGIYKTGKYGRLILIEDKFNRIRCIIAKLVQDRSDFNIDIIKIGANTCYKCTRDTQSIKININDCKCKPQGDSKDRCIFPEREFGY